VKSIQRLIFELAYDTEITAQKQDTAEEDEQVHHICTLYRNILSESSVRSSFSTRCLLLARLLGRHFETRLWTIVGSRTGGGGLEEGRNLDILCDKADYLRLQEETCGLHLNRAADRKSRAAVTARKGLTFTCFKIIDHLSAENLLRLRIQHLKNY
jgi:hypothetical protein